MKPTFSYQITDIKEGLQIYYDLVMQTMCGRSWQWTNEESISLGEEADRRLLLYGHNQPCMTTLHGWNF